MPNKYLSAIIVGNSYCAILINVIQGIFLLTFSDLFENTLIYYIIASVILIVTGLLNCKFQELEFVRYWLIKANNRSATGDNAPENAYNLRKDSVNTMDSNSN
jgi:CBS-domain-containing membrane protein